jgi:hypothetical protein
MVEWTDHIDLFRSRSCAEHVASGDVKVQPLYRSPTLTDEEREAIEKSAREWDDCHDKNAQAIAETLRGLLERSAIKMTN